jgi:hypothetical protein
MTKNRSKNLPLWLIDKLPAFDSAHYLPQRFEDSTHDLWQLKGRDSVAGSTNMFLKVCNNTRSPFWQIMEHQFGFNLRVEIGGFDKLYSHIDEVSPLTIPQLIQAETHQITSKQHGAFILTSELNGSVIGAEDVALPMVDQLSDHLIALHRQTQSNWGVINRQSLQVEEWHLRLQMTLIKSAKKWGGVSKNNDKYLKQALKACETSQTDEFIPMMPDLRWDQFLVDNGKLHALVDLDAFVLAPRELDFVLLEYILSPEHFDHFIKFYSQHHSVPDISQVRPAYRLLLFYMQVLGEQDIDAWMNAEHHFS